MWKNNIEKFFKKNYSLENFRELGSVNGKLTSWNANEQSSRWFKFLIFNTVKQKSDDFFIKYSHLGNTSLGNPPYIKFNDLKINLDYLLAIDEYEFISKNIEINEIKNVFEIGAGFGRTTHVMLKLIKNLEHYVIIDLPELLELSKKYLESVLNKDEFSKVTFLSSEENHNKNIDPDLVLNINSFQEMYPEVIDFYKKEYISQSKYFFSRNAICKYNPSDVDIEGKNSDDVFELGYCREVVNIFDNKEIKNQLKFYIDRYNPGDWSFLSGEEDLFPYYYKVIYKNKKIE